MKRTKSPEAVFRFRLLVAGETPNSVQALGNLTKLCQQLLAGRHEIEVVDVFRDPQVALADGIFMTPTLIKLSPAPVRTIVGTLADMPTVLRALGLDGPPE